MLSNIRSINLLAIVIDIVIVKIKSNFLSTQKISLNNNYFYYNYNI